MGLVIEYRRQAKDKIGIGFVNLWGEKDKVRDKMGLLCGNLGMDCAFWFVV